jgi:putative phage-type endonuclease
MIELLAAPQHDQWLQDRRSRLGATDMSALLGLNPYRVAYEVWLEKRDLLEPWSGNAATRLGQRLEPGLLDEAEQRWGKLKRNVVVKHANAPLAATLDGWLVESKTPVEIKTAGMLSDFADVSGWGEQGSDEIPDHYLVQVHTQLACTDSESAKVLALIAGRGIVEYEVFADPKVSQMIVGFAADWWDTHIVRGIEPDRTKPPSLEVLKRIRRQPNSVVALDASASELVEQWEAAKEARKSADEIEEDRKKQLILTLGTSEGGQLPDGRMVTFLEQTRKEYVCKESTFRVLRIQKAKKGRR